MVAEVRRGPPMGSFARSCKIAVVLATSVAGASASLLAKPATGRSLKAQDSHDHDHGAESETSFIEFLGSESAMDHILELYADSGSTEGAVSWLVEASREGCAAAKDDGHDDHGHEGHNHRRLLQLSAAEEDEHDHDHDHDHDHGDEEPHTDEDEHAGHDPGDEETAHSDEEHDHEDHSGHDHGTAQQLEMALQYVMACQVDSNCVIEAKHSENAKDKSADGSEGKLWGLKIGLSLVFVAMSILFSFVPELFKGFKSAKGILSTLNTFASGIFLAVAFMHLLPEVLEFQALAGLDTDFPVGFSLLVTGFALTLFVEHVVFGGHGHSHGIDDEDVKMPAAETGKRSILKDITTTYRGPMIMQVATIVHATLESVALGLAGAGTTPAAIFAGCLGSFTFAAHKSFESLGVATRLHQRGCPNWLVPVLLLPLFVIPFIGVLVGTAISSENFLLNVILNGLAAGTFLYVGAFEIMGEEFGHGDAHDDSNAKEEDTPSTKAWYPNKAMKFISFLIGIGLIFLVTALIPHSHAH